MREINMEMKERLIAGDAVSLFFNTITYGFISSINCNQQRLNDEKTNPNNRKS